MRITCALTDSQIEKLYANAYGKMLKAMDPENPTAFDSDMYMQDMFNMIAKAKDDATAAKFAQQLPSILIHIAVKDEFLDLDISTDNLRKLARAFKEENDGIITTAKYFNPEVSPEVLLALVESKKADAFEQELVDPSDAVNEARLRPYSIFTGTLQEFVAIDPKLKSDLTVEVVDESKKRIYNALNKIKEENNNAVTILDNMTFQGRVIKLKAVRLTDTDRTKLDDYTNFLISRSIEMQAEGKARKDVTQAQDMLLLVMSDKDGNELYFDEEGNITTKDQGKLVYQFIRDVRLSGNKYVHTNMYGYDNQLTSPETLAKLSNISVEEATELQQKELEQVYNFKNEVLKNGPQVIDLVGISPGVSDTVNEKNLSFKRLQGLPIGTNEAFNTIRPVIKGSSNFEAGGSTITLNGKEFPLERPVMSRELAIKIAAVLTNPNISLEDRYDFIDQFLSNKINAAVRRHYILYKPSENLLGFQYDEFTINQKKASPNQKSKAPYLSLNDIDTKSEQERKDIANTIYSVLMKASSNKTNDKFYPTKFKFSENNLDTKLYRDYDVDAGEFIDGQSYIEFIKNQDASVKLNSTIDPGFFNSYVEFRLPTEFTKEVNAAKDEVKKADNRSFVRRLKDDTVEYINANDGMTNVTVRYSNMSVSETTQQPFAYFTFTSPFSGQEGKIYLDPKYRKDESKLPKLGDEIYLVVENTPVPNIVRAYNSEGDAIGNMQETDFEANEAPRDYSKKEETKEQEIKLEQDDKLNDDIDPSTRGISSLFERTSKLPNNVTREQIDAATEWWKSSPLADTIPLEHLANIVNSNAYARFIVAGKKLTDVRIQVNAKTGGNMVDVYHESWHAFSQLFLTKDQKTKLYNEFKKNNPEYKDKSFFEVEEAIAEEFRNYALDGNVKKGQPVRNTLFRKILNFIKKLLGMISEKDILFQNLYFAGQNPKLLNDYTPLIDNVMFDTLNRGPQQVGEPKKDALNRQDGNSLVTTMDSIWSQIVDQVYSDRAANAALENDAKLATKAGTIKLLLNENNKQVVYSQIKNRLIAARDRFKKELGSVTEKPFNTFTTLENLEDNALAVMKIDGVNKYVFLSSQIDSFDKLNLATKNGDRVKGQTYDGVDIISDFYNHTDIVDAANNPVEIVVVANAEDANVQYNNYVIANKGYESLTVNERPELKPLSIKEEGLLNKIRILETAINNWGNATSGMVKYHIENSRYEIIRRKEEEKDNEDDTDPVDDSNLENSARTGKQDIGKLSVEEMASKETIYILKSLHKKNRDGSYEVDMFGFRQLADFRSTWNNTLRTIGGIKDPKKQMDLLTKASTSFPEFTQLLNFKLPDPLNPKDEYEMATTTGFYQDFGRLTQMNVLQLTLFNDGGTAVVEASVDTNVIQKRFINRFKSDTTNEYITKTPQNISVLNINKVVSDFKNPKGEGLDTNRSLDFARAIGIYLDDLTIINNELTGSQKQIEFYGLPYIYDIIKKLAKKELEAGVTPQAKDFVKEFKLDPLTYLASKIPANVIGDTEETQKTQIERLLTLQVKYGSDGANFSAINAEGNSINRHIKDNTISMYVYGLNSATKLSDLWTRDDIRYMSFMDPKVNPFTNRLATTRTLFDLSTPEALKRSGRSMEFFLNSGTQQEALEGTSTTSLDIYSKYLQDIHTMLQGGMIEFIRAASKSSSFGTRIDGIIDPTGKKKNDPRLWIDIDRFASGTAENYAFNVHFLQYIAGEYDRITKFKANKDIAKSYKGYNRKVGGTKENPIYAGETFIIFDKVLTPTTKKDIMSKVGSKDLIEYLKTDPELKTKIYNDVVNYFNEQVEQNLKMLSEAEYISNDVYNKLAMFNMNKAEAMDTLIKAFTYNSWIQNFETVMIFLGDPAEVNHDKEEEHKRNTMAQSNGPGFRTDQGARNFINGYAKKTSYAQTLDEKYRVFNFDGTFDTAIAEDVKRTSVYIDVFKEKLTEYYTKKLSKSTLKNKEQLIKDKVENDLSKYTNMEEGDGQGYITFDAYRTLKILENDWDWNEQEKLFQKIVKGETIDPDSIVKFFSPYKIQNYGRLANANLILPITAGHKFEVVPLIPSVIKGSDWESLHLQMLAANKQYITYSTGSKIGSITSEVDKDGVAVADEIYEPGSDKKVLKKDIKFTSNKVYLETVKKVTNVAVEYKKKGIFPTQMRVLVLDGMFENGELVNPDDAPLVDNYVNSVSNLSDIIEKELLNDIGYTFKDGKVSGDLTRFMKVVQRELERKGLPQHLIKFIGVNPDNTLKIDLSLHPNADEIEKILTNLIEKPLIKQKVKGEGLLQVASSMTNGIWDKGLKKETVADVLKFIGTNNLPFYHPGPDGKTLAMKIAISLQGDFANLLNLEYKGERIATRERLNVAIKDDEWLDANDKRNRQAITLSGVRIPTDSKSQMEFAEVYEFLDPAAGNIVILPTEMVGKTGGDYDGDKLTTQMPHISKKGNFIRRKWSEKELNDKVEELKAKGKNKEAAAIIKLHKKVVENELISSIRGILEIPEYYVDLIKPTSTDTLEGIADELQDFVSDYDRFQRAHGEKPRTEIKNGKEVKYISPTNIFEVGYNLHKHQANLDAARPLGITAVENKLSALLNSIGAKMPDKYKFAFYSDPKGRWIETDKIYDMRLFLPHNKVNVNGVDHISISGIDSVDMENVISVLNTQLLNGFLDVEKKPWPFYIQGNLEIVPMLINLLQVGVPVRDAIYFVSNPMVREYAKQQRLIKSKFAHLIGKSVTSPAFTQYQAAVNTLEKYGPSIKGFVKPNTYITNKTYYNAVTKATGLPNVLNADGYFDSNILRRVVEEEGNPSLMPEQFAMFLHFLELEKEFKGYQALKRQFNPDTKTSKTLQEITKRDVAFEDLDSSSKIDKETKRRAREESLLTSFFDASKVVVDVVKPLFPFRNNDKVTDFIIKALQARSNQIRYNYGTGREATSKFITDFKNAVTTAMFQKSVGTIFDPNGEPMTFERMVSAGPNSYSAMVFDVIEKLPKEVKDKYPVLQQLSPILLKSGQRVLTLNDRKQAKGELADIYYQNLKELANVNVRKVANTERNQYISQIFQMLPLVTVYQNGVGYSAYGFNSSLPYDEIIDVLQAAADDYIKDDMTVAEFVKIINKLAPSAPIEGLEEVRKKSPFKNYNASDAVIVSEMPPLSIKFDDVEDSDASDSELPTEKDLETGEVVAKRTFGAPKQPTLSTTSAASDYTNHSGGAIGSDTQWDVIGKEFGMVNNRHYFTGEKGPKNAPLGNVDITDQPIAVEGASKVAQAAKQMWGYKYNTMKDQRLIRNWAQVANSDAVFAIGTLGKEGDIWKGDEKSAEPRKLLKVAVQGGTGYAVEMAIQAGKPVYVFDQVRNQWYKNINGEWSKSEVPTLTKKFAGIGTREINEAGKQAIRDVYVNTFKPTTDLSTSPIKPTINTSREWSGDLKTRPVYTTEGVNTMRTEVAKKDEHFGNPFSEAGYGGTIKVASIGAAVRMYKDWLLNNAVTDSEIVSGSVNDLAKFDNQRAWILDQINQGKLDGATLLYAGKSEARGEGMHPTALAEVVEQLRATQPSTSVETEVVIPGVEIKRNAITKEEQLELFNILKPYIEQQGAKTNKATSANVMIGLGLRWDYKSNNPNYKSIEIKNIIVPGSSAKYGYYEVSINGQPLGPINPRIKTLMSKATGIDATDYDGAIINLYTDKTFISAHNDVDEAADAIGYPVLVLNIGGSGNFSVQQTGKYEPTPLNSGDSYVFGINGENRKVMHRTFPSKQDGFLPAITTAIDGETYSEGSYRLSITLRRVKNLEPGMPSEPTVKPVGEVKEEVSVKLINDEDIARFKAYVEKAGGLKPKEFFTASTKFSIFYNSASGRKEGAPQESKWLLNIDGMYDLVDQITGEIYLTNVDLLTGTQTITKTKAEEIEDKIKDIETQIAKGKLGGAQLAQEIEGKLDANKDQLIALLGQTMYSKNLKDVVYKELLQNAFDATKIAIAEGLIKKGDVDITIDEKERTITFTDNGIGMSPEIVQKAFFTIGGTYKGENVDNKLKSGGLGLAKMAFIFGSERLILKTVNNGVETTVDATSQEIRNDNFKINTKSSSKANGTSVTVKIPETYTDAKGEKRNIDFPSYTSSEENYSFLAKPLIGDIDVKYSIKNRIALYSTEESKKLKLGTIPEGYTLFTNATTDFAEIEIYIDSNKPESKYQIKHQILSSGLYQFDKAFKVGPDKIPLNIIVNIKPTVDTVNPQYPFNNQREDFRPTVDSDITALNHYLGTLWKTIELKMLKNSFSKIQNIEAIDINNVDRSVIAKNKELLKSFEAIDEKTIITDTINDFRNLDKDLKITNGGVRSSSRSITKDEIKKEEEEKGYKASFRATKEIKIDKSFETGLNPNKPIVHNNTNIQLSETDVKFLSEISSVLLEYKKSIMKFYGEDYSDNLKTQLWGVSIDKTYGGVNVNPSFVNMLAINPFYHLPNDIKVDMVNYIAIAIDHLIIHELNHNFVRNEGAEFTGRFLQTYAEIQSLPNHFELFSNLKLVIKNNIQTIKKLNYEYGSASNVESGFEGNKLQQSDQERADRGYEAVSADDTKFYEGTEEALSGSNNEFGEIIRAATSKKESPAFKKQKNAAIKSIQDGVKNYRLDEIMAVNGYDYKDIISNLEAATTETEFNKIINKILKYLC